MFSVIIPLYNKAKYIEKAVASVLSQSLLDFELIIIDDGSTDDSLSIVSQSFTDKRIRVISQPNLGVSVARNNGVKVSQFEYITFLDADDWWDRNFLSSMKVLIDLYPDAGIYGSSYYIVKNKQNNIAPIGFDISFRMGLINYLQVYAQNLCMPLTSISVVIPTSVFEKEGGFSSKLNFGEDFDLWLRIALHYPVAFINQKLAYYNQDVELSNRAVGNLHKPESHFLWNLDYLAYEETTNDALKELLDKLRVYGLLPYYVTKEYNKLAIQELKKVDWKRQPFIVRNKYKLPMLLLKQYLILMKVGSLIKQKIFYTLK